MRAFQFVADGVFKAELNEFLTRELAEDGYSGVEVRVTPTRTEIIIMATRTQVWSSDRVTQCIIANIQEQKLARQYQMLMMVGMYRVTGG